jgi:hypothetical protein
MRERLEMAMQGGEVVGIPAGSPATERRREGRRQAGVLVRIWGTDTRGERFSRQTVATNISNGGALLSIEDEPRCGDLVGIAHEGRHPRFRVIWVRNSGDARKIQVAVQKLEGDACPWEAALLHPVVSQD